MPNARTHDIITIATGAAMVPVALNSGLPDMGPTNVGVLVGSHIVSGLLFSPDLDLPSAPYRRWNLLRWVWLPYQGFVRHRSWVSHSFVVGPLLRIAYFTLIMSLIALAVLGIINLLVPIDPTGTLLNVSSTAVRWIETHPYVVLYALLGFILGGAAHTVADILVSGAKRRFRRAVRSALGDDAPQRRRARRDY